MNDEARSSTLGGDGVYLDALWGIEVALTRLEQRLLRTWVVRRLGFVVHAGAAATVSNQTYSRLEHSLGLLALVAHVRPGATVQRAAALLHDVGHPPFSHTAEGLAGLDHHGLGAERIRGLDALLRAEGTSADEVVEVLWGAESFVGSCADGLGLDHLDSFVRSGRVHGRLREPPAVTLSRLRLTGSQVDTDAATGRYLVDLAVAEATWQSSEANVVATAVLRGLVDRLLVTRGAAYGSSVAQLTDDELWAVLLDETATAATIQRFRRDPGAWRIVVEDSEDLGADAAGDASEVVDAFPFTLRRQYLVAPLVDGAPAPIGRRQLEGLRRPPWHCVVARPRDASDPGPSRETRRADAACPAGR